MDDGIGYPFNCIKYTYGYIKRTECAHTRVYGKDTYTEKKEKKKRFSM